MMKQLRVLHLIDSDPVLPRCAAPPPALWESQEGRSPSSRRARCYTSPLQPTLLLQEENFDFEVFSALLLGLLS